MLKDSIIAAMLEDPEARDDADEIGGEAARLGLDEGGMGDDAGPKPRAAVAGERVAGDDAEGGRLAYEGGKVDARVRRAGPDGEVK